MDNILRRYCKLYSIIFFLLIVESRGHDSNETSNDHRQSRVTGRIVKLYSGTRPEPILCAGEGFQGDPNDCAVFYRCMKSGRGKYTVFRFQCGPGTVYDPETEVCNHPRSTKRVECGGLSTPAPTVDRLNNNEIEGAQNEIPSPITSLPIRIETTTGAQTIFSTAYPWASSSIINNPTKRQTLAHSTGFTNAYTTAASPETSVTQSQQYTTRLTNPPTSTVTQISSRDNICTSDGFMGDSENCRKFYRCVGNQRGTYTRFEFSCSESTIWDDDTQSCNHAWAVKRSRCGRSNQDSQYTTNKDVFQKPTSTDKTIQQQLQISYGSDVTQTQTQISNGSVIQNQTQINFGDRLNSNKGTKATQNQTQISHGSATSQSQTQIDFSDKGVQTQLQIDHSKQTSQSQVQVHASTTKGPSTSTSSSTPHASSQESNICSRSGFMGDTNDCKKFYRCIDNGSGGYTKFEFSCGQGTVWDQSIEACNHAWAVKECGGKGPIETTSTTQAATSTSTSTQNYYTTSSTENYQTTSGFIPTEDNEDSGYGQPNQNPTVATTASSLTTLSSTTVVSTTAKLPSNGNCQSSGFIGDANDCKIFYRCVENGRGGFTKYEFKCGEGTVWDPDLEACNHAWAVKRCGGHASSDDHKVDTTTEKAPTLSTVSTQTTVVTQSPTESAATQDDDYDTGYGSVNNEISSSTTTTTKQPHKEDNVGNVCRSSGFMGDENDCKKFYRCVDNGNGGYIRYEFTCGEGTVWDPKIEACNHAWAVEKCGGSTVNNQEATTAKPATTVEEADKGTTESIHNTIASTISSSSSSTSPTTESTSSGSNECTRDGFMGDQKDCKKFYRCVNNGKGSFTKYEFSCGEGTVWDQKIEACNHAWAVEKCGGTAVSSPTHLETTTLYRPTMNDEIDNGYPSNIDTGYEISTQKTTTTQSVPSSSVAAGEGNSCTTSGFVGDKNDCKKFYRCVDNGNGGFIRYEFSCGEGTLWDQSIEACNHAWAVKDCGTGINTIHTSSQSPTHVTSTSDNEDQGYPQSTEKTTTTTVSTYPDEGTSGECSKEGFTGDKRNCKKFYRCVDNGRGGYTKYEFTCGEGTYWNQEILSCDHATSTKPCGEIESSSSTQTSEPAHDEIYTEVTSSSTEENIYQTQKPPTSSGVCTSEGFYGDPNDCKKFYRCVDNGKGSYTKYDFTCGDGTVWDQEIQACNHESNNRNCSSSSSSQSTSTSQTTEKSPEAGSSTTTVSQIQHSTEKTDSSSVSSSNQCTSEGFFADPNDCKKFIRCVSNEKGGYTKYEFSCGEGTIWVQDILACDHDTDKTTCSPQSTTRPSTSEGHPQTTEKVEASTSTSRPQTTDKLEDEYDSGTSDKPTQPGSGVCSSEGFYGNENDCRQFYRCVDNGQGGYTKYDFTCGEGTAWDSEIQTCNHIDQVKNCHGTSESHPVMHDEDNTQSTGTSSAPESSTAASSTSSSTSTSSTTNSETSQGSSSPNKNSCDSEGYFGDTQDCKKFYRCVDNGKGGYTKYDYVCGEGTIWDQDITTCNHPQDVVNPSCNQKQESTTSTTMASSSDSSSSSSTQSSTQSQSSSTQSSTESSQSSSAQTTQSTSNCSQEDSSKKPVNQNITCDKAGYYPNPNDCKKFYRCVDWDGDGKRFSVYHFECGEGTIWDPAVETCNHEESVYPPRDCSGTQSQSENQPSATEGTTTTQQETSSSQGSTTQSSSTSQSTTQSTTTEPTTQQSTTSEQTTTQQSTSSAQTTTEKSTISEPATTQSSTTSEPTTQSSTTSEQTTQSSTTSEQTTQSSTTSEQTTQSSTTSEQTTQSSTTSEQTTQSSTTSEQTTQSSTTSEQTTQSSTTSEPTTQSSTTSEPTTQSSTTSEQTTTEQSTTTTDQTTTEQSTTSEPTTEQSTTAEQTTQESTTTEQSTTEQSTTEQSTTESSTTESSTTESSTTESSTTESSTSESTTTEQSTTQQSTTTEQSTTEELTSSEGTTTEQSTTEQTTTEQTTESSTTESGSDNTSESKCPETSDDQSLFVCPTSFRRHPKYCNLFYQCDENNDTHDVKIAVFTCPNNTIYDENQTRCVEESKADKKCDGQIAQKRRFKRLDKHYKEPLVASKESYKCSSAGYFSFEKDSECSPAFLKCKTDKTNKIRGFVYQCPNGYVYWSISKRCEPINRVRDCKRSNNDWSERWEIPVERRNVAPSSA